MARRKAHAPLVVLINGRLVGVLEKAANGAVSFRYADSWLAWKSAFAVSLSMPLSPQAYRGDAVSAVFDNLLPDRPATRRRVAERMGAEGIDSYSLLEAIGRDCVGAMQFLPEAEGQAVAGAVAPNVEGEPVNDAEIEAILADLTQAPLGVDRAQEFRISVAGAQEKTALLRIDGQWHRPFGTTPTTHILKPQLGQIQHAKGVIDMSDSVDNEHYCLRLLKAFGLDVAHTEIVTFGARRVLVVERFDRLWRGTDTILRLPQEDLCQALGIPPSLKYQNQGGPGMRDVLALLAGSDEPQRDQAAFFKSQILFWLIGATDGHGKNFSIFLGPGGLYSLTPFYDVLSAQPAFDLGQIPRNEFRLAMSVGKQRHYQLIEVLGRHFVQTGSAAGLGRDVMFKVITEVLDQAGQAPDDARGSMPNDFAPGIHENIVAAIGSRLPALAAALDELR